MKAKSHKKDKKQDQKDDHQGQTRRSFLTRLWIALGFIASLEFVVVVIAFLQPRRSRAEKDAFGSIVEAGSVADFARGSVTAIVRGHFYLACLEDGSLLALTRKCSHLGCTVIWDSENGKFVCPCHASAFDIRGDVISSPASRALDFFPITVENDIVKVDTRKPIRRSEFRTEQVMHPNDS